MTTVSTVLDLPVPSDLVVIAAQDIIDQGRWRVLSMSSSEIVFQERDYDFMNGAAPKIVATLVERGAGTQVRIVCSVAGVGPLMKKRVVGFMGQFVNSLSLRTQTNSVAINPTVQIGEGQGGASPSQSDRYDMLRKAKELFDAGVLTDEEFRLEKARILANEP